MHATQEPTAPTQPGAEIAALLAEALMLVERKPQQAWAIAQQALRLAHDSSEVLTMARARHAAGVCLTTLGRFAAARTELAQAEATFLDHDHLVAAACCRRDGAIAAYFAGDYPAAEVGFSSALTVLQASDQAMEASRCLRWMAIMANFRHETSAAREQLMAARALLAAFDAPSDQAACLYVEGMIAFRETNYAGAFEALEEAATHFAALGEEVSLGRVRYEQGHVLLAQEHFGEAATVAEQALALFQRHELPHRVGMASELLGLIATYTNQFDAAYELLEAAQGAYQAAGMEVHRLHALLHRANLDFYLQAWSAAETNYQQVASAARVVGAHDLVLAAESNLGLVAHNQDRYDVALAHMQAALEQAWSLDRHDHAARCHRHLAKTYAEVGNTVEAYRHFARARELLAQVDTPLSRARLEVDYAEFCRRMGAYREAAALLAAARTTLAAHAAPVFVADCDLRWARLALEEGDLQKAEALAASCAAIYAEHQLPLALASVQRVQADLLARQGQAREARQIYEQAFAMLVSPLPAEAADIASALARIAREAGDPRAALQWLQQGVQLLQQARARVPTEHLAAELARQYAPHLRVALEVALHLDEREVALALAEDARAQVALAWLEGVRRSEPTDALARHLAGRRQALRKALDAAAETAAPSTYDHPATRPAPLPDLARLQAEYDETLALWRRFGSGVVPGTVEPFDWVSCRSQLNELAPAWQALVYWLDDDWLIGWQCSATAIHCWQRRLCPAEQFSLQLCCDTDGSTRAFLYDRSPAALFTTAPGAEHLRRVANLLLPPGLAPSLTADQPLMIVPAGMLHTLPFAALPLEGRPLMTHAVLLMAPSLQLLVRLVGRPPSPGARALALGVRHHAARSLLPEACAEAALAATAYAADVWCDMEATTSRLRHANTAGLLRDYRLIHLATHAWSTAPDGTPAGIALADGDLLASDLAQLQLDADLVVLSACESGIGRHFPGEEIVGLAYALLQAGARALLVSLWQVGDAASVEMMQAFYAGRCTGLQGPLSLAMAQRQAWRAGRPASVWAPYHWIGKPAG